MIDFSLSEEERAVRDTVRLFVDRELKPLEEEVLRNERCGLPSLEPGVLRDLQRKAGAAGFWGITIPEEYGGIALGAVMHSIVEMELGRTFVPFRFGGEADNILFACTGQQRDDYLLPTIAGERRACFALTEPGAGSDLSSICTTAKREGRDWVINGEKIFISGGSEADFCILFARTDEGITAFLVDREMGWKSSPIPLMGQRRAASLSFEDVRVPNANVLGEVGGGLDLALTWIGQKRYVIPSLAVGAAERLLEMAIDYARVRKSMGHAIADYQAIQWQIADSEVEIESAKWLTLHAAWRVERGLDARHAISIAKLHGSVMANQVVDRVMQIHGAMGYTKELPVERWYRDLRVMRIYEGTDEIQRRTIARNLIKGHVKLGAVGE
ncbi:acyl-CoA dehydrogenase family protein [Rhodococcus sp. Rp3]|uniref:acyl-CoA dehydrogenase family protein n=1 Tax=Rhodococcus sp. Rp3 TaxID=2807635 RepID=UPI00233E7D9A|nr:acyl-CoA dehydrogenase family protein [Rhodococcus sp. Rp3]MDC3724391.1 acyl-CoA dehydrogenase family protein [Rhodococcus sp. Rp3]